MAQGQAMPENYRTRRPTKIGCAAKLGKDLVKKDLDKKHEKMAGRRLPVPARDLLALGRNHFRNLSRA